MVHKAHAVVDPGAMVVHSSDTGFASRAVVTAGRLERLAFLALFTDCFLQERKEAVVFD